jgi:transposase
MRIRTLLNKCQYLKSFVYENEFLENKNGQEVLVVQITPRKNSKPRCSCCGKRNTIYDHQSQRDFEFVPMWGFKVFFRYNLRRVNCPTCGVKVEHIPWAESKHTLTNAYAQFLAHWAKKLSWLEVARSFKTSWYHVYQGVKQIVEYGLQNRNLEAITAIGIDEIHYGKGHQYLTMVYQIDQNHKRLLCVEANRTSKSLLKCFRTIGKENLKSIKFVCTDMWKAYLKVVKKKLPKALNILDRFHIVKKLNEAINKVRIQEVAKLKKEGFEAVLAKSKYCFLKRVENLSEKQSIRLKDLLKLDLQSVKAYLYKQSFEMFWQYKSPYWANLFLEKWCNSVMHSNLYPMKTFVKTLRNHQVLLMNWFKAKKVYSSGIVEGLNRKVNLVTRKSYGFRSYDILKIALFHTMGNLPEPKTTHSLF